MVRFLKQRIIPSAKHHNLIGAWMQPQGDWESDSDNRK